jgi:hypothetical protein
VALPVSPPTAGSAVTAGSSLGYVRFGVNTVDFDIAVKARTSTGVRNLSFIQTVTDGLLATYDAWAGAGTQTRDSFSISRAARDADPLTCNGETFTSIGSLPSWFFDGTYLHP